MKIPIFEQLTDDDDMFDDELNWFTPGKFYTSKKNAY